MLDNYINEQPISYRLLINSIKKNRPIHAYLFVTNGYYKSLDMALAFCKYIMCPDHKTNLNDCHSCSICHRIDNNIFSEITIINPDGMWIKKEQLETLQTEFNNKALETEKKIYIINHADKMNTSAANSILKFLEEPEDNIIAILVVDNIHHLLPTIVSRCQVINLNNKIDYENKPIIEVIANILFTDKETISLYVNNTQNINKINQIINFVNFYEKSNLNTILYTSKLWHDNFKTKEDIDIAFNIIVLYYKDVLNYKCNQDIVIFHDSEQNINYIASKNSMNQIMEKINIIIDTKNKNKFNVNNALMMDKLIMQLERV